MPPHFHCRDMMVTFHATILRFSPYYLYHATFLLAVINSRRLLRRHTIIITTPFSFRFQPATNRACERQQHHYTAFSLPPLLMSREEVSLPGQQLASSFRILLPYYTRGSPSRHYHHIHASLVSLQLHFITAFIVTSLSLKWHFLSFPSCSSSRFIL